MAQSLGYGEHGATATATAIVEGAALHVHDALLLLRDISEPPSSFIRTTAVLRAPVETDPNQQFLANHLPGNIRADPASLKVPTAGMPPHPHFPALNDLPYDTAEARAVLAQLPVASLVPLLHGALEELAGGAGGGRVARLRNLEVAGQDAASRTHAETRWETVACWETVVDRC